MMSIVLILSLLALSSLYYVTESWKPSGIRQMTTKKTLASLMKSWKPTGIRQMTTKKTLASLMIATSLIPSVVLATPLGEHTTCSYPACTSKEEILKANAPGLVSQQEKDGYLNDLKDMQFIIDNGFGLMLEQKDYASMRAGLRQSPMSNLRLTVRKYKEFLDDSNKQTFMSEYAKMIDNLDTMDVYVFKRTQGGMADKDVAQELEKVKTSFHRMMDVVVAKGSVSTEGLAPAP
jgi:hypothetical protein